MKVALTVSLITDKISIGYPSIRFGCFFTKGYRFVFHKGFS